MNLEWGVCRMAGILATLPCHGTSTQPASNTVSCLPGMHAMLPMPTLLTAPHWVLL